MQRGITPGGNAGNVLRERNGEAGIAGIGVPYRTAAGTAGKKGNVARHEMRGMERMHTF